ncbi:hypothetical protein ACA910_006432 [Epithemia clementina (nom. ined.)]
MMVNTVAFFRMIGLTAFSWGIMVPFAGSEALAAVGTAQTASPLFIPRLTLPRVKFSDLRELSSLQQEKQQQNDEQDPPIRTVAGLEEKTRSFRKSDKINQDDLNKKKKTADDAGTATSTTSALVTEALQGIGMLAIAGPFFSYDENKKDQKAFDKRALMKAMALCLQEQAEDGHTATSTFPDGTIRHSLGREWNAQQDASSVPPLLATTTTTSWCQEFDKRSSEFRSIFTQVLEVVVQAVQKELGLESTILLRRSSSNRVKSSSFPAGGADGYTLLDIVQQGDVIEHYHAYHHAVSSSSAAMEEPPLAADDWTKTKAADVTVTQEGLTMDWHVDQGLFLLFTPGEIDSKATEGLYVKLRDGSTKMVQFSSSSDNLTTGTTSDDHDDDLIILMLGDGVNQFVNDGIVTRGEHRYEQLHAPLYAVPHAFAMPQKKVISMVDNHDMKTLSSSPRLWYGRMALPPPQAQHPMYADWTYGELRKVMTDERMAGNDQGPALSIGCASKFMRALSSDTSVDYGGSGHNDGGTNTSTCDDGTFPCWHQCQNVTEDCEAQGKDLACIRLWKNENGVEERLVWDGSHQTKEFFPGCIDNITTATMFDPTIHTTSSAAPTPSPQQQTTTTAGAGGGTSGGASRLGRPLALVGALDGSSVWSGALLVCTAMMLPAAVVTVALEWMVMG